MENVHYLKKGTFLPGYRLLSSSGLDLIWCWKVCAQTGACFTFPLFNEESKGLSGSTSVINDGDQSLPNVFRGLNWWGMNQNFIKLWSFSSFLSRLLSAHMYVIYCYVESEIYEGTTSSLPPWWTKSCFCLQVSFPVPSMS